MKWSPPFERLYNILKQINTHLTFLSTHSRTTLPTFQLIQKLNDTITELDLAIIQHLLPHGEVFFEYVDRNEVAMFFTEKVKFSWDKGYEQAKTSINDAYDGFGTEEDNTVQILIFDFMDSKLHGIGGAIKGSKRRKIAENSRAQQGIFQSYNSLGIAPVDLASLTNIIRSRNEKFKSCLNKFLSQFSEKELETSKPYDCLVKSVSVPKPLDHVDPVESLSQVSSSLSKDEKPDIEAMVKMLKTPPFYKDQIVEMRTLVERRESQILLLACSRDIHPDLIKALKNYKGIDINSQLYSHQTKALEVLFHENKQHVIVSTSTSSGKSFIYQLPILNDILWNIEAGYLKRKATAIFVFPTKALAQDQKRHLQDLVNYLDTNSKRKIIIETFDGDTPSKDRSFVRMFADIIFTNPDTIHAAILPHHESSPYHKSTGWRNFLQCLKYTVMDELHVYKGVFGVNVSYVMARLNRICKSIYNNDRVRFVSCSATILNPESHFRTICAIPLEELVFHIGEDGSPCSERRLLVWNPPPLMNKNGRMQSENDNASSKFIPRENMVPELVKVLVHLLSNFPSLKVIMFCPIRAVCELAIKEARRVIKENISKGNNSVKDCEIMAYRGGYSKEDRRIIEGKIFSGQLRGIVATNALELGIDLSDLDVVITCGFPILKLNLHQQFGRAGRGKDSKGSLAIFVAGSTPVDQYYMNHVDEICNRDTYEDLCVDGLIETASTEFMLELHLQCAAFEKKIDPSDDLKWFVLNGSKKLTNIFLFIIQDKLVKDVDGLYCTSPKYLPEPLQHVSLRSMDEVTYSVVDITNNRNTVIEEVEELRTSFTLYEGGIFLHQGIPYLVKVFDPDNKFAKVERVNVDWITSQRDFTDIDPSEIEYIRRLNPAKKHIDVPVYYGSIVKTTIVFGFFKVNRRSEILEAVEVNNPPVILFLKGFWIDLPSLVLEIIVAKELSPAGGIHAAQHTIMNLLPLFVNTGAKRNDDELTRSNLGNSELLTECKAPEKEFSRRQTSRIRPNRLILYDTNGGKRGSGIAAKTFEHIDDILQACYDQIRACECEWGCQRCIHGSFCTEMSLVMSKPAAIIIFAHLVGLDAKEILKSIPDGPEENMPTVDIETIKPCTSLSKFSPNVEIVN